MATTKLKAPREKHKYEYIGAVFINGNIWDRNFKTQTIAVSKAKAWCNVRNQVLEKDGREKGQVMLTGHLMLSV